jgi:glucose-1-phosphate thymidylyltransferase
MRAADPAVDLTPDQHRAADAGLKPLIPVHGRPFLDYVLSGLADAGVTRIALVVAPDHQQLREYYERDALPSRVRVSFVVQNEPIGTADALLAAESWTRDEPFLVMNADNIYPTGPLTELAGLDEPGLLAFDRDDLIASGNIPRDRIAAFALLTVDADGYLTGIVEKPAGGEMGGLSGSGTHARVSMNCWHFDARIFAACREVPRSVRGEFELPEAVGLAVRRGMKLRALPARGPVLDLSRRADAASVAQHLADMVPRP